MGPLTPDQIALVRQCSRDDDAFETLMSLFDDRMALVLRSLPFIVYTYDLHTRTPIFYQDSFLGYNREVLMSHDSIIEVVHPDDAEIVRASWSAIADDVTAIPVLEYRVRHKAGHWEWVREQKIVMRPGELLVVLSIISPRKVVENHLEQSEALFRALTRANPDYVTVVDGDGRVQYVNRVPPGVDENAFIGSLALDVVMEDYQAEARAALARALTQGDTVSIETPGLRPDGTKGWLAHRIVPIERSGAMTGAVIISTDITQHKEVERQEHAQRVLSDALLDMAATINSTLEFDKVLDRIMVNIELLVAHEDANIMLLENGGTRVVASRGRSSVATMLQSLVGSNSPYMRRMYREHQPVIVGDMAADPDWISIAGGDVVRSYLGVPIMMAGSTIGFLNVTSRTPDFYTRVHANNLLAFADHAGIAIHNTRTHIQALKLAMLNERERLARDLHDSVNQTLFSANVIAEMLLRMWGRNPEQILEGLSQLHQLTRSAQFEMRTLLMELHPAALGQADLNDLLQQLATIFTNRTGIPVMQAMDSGVRLEADTQIAIYRIVQEALNNIAKHARATQVEMDLSGGPPLILTISDNGKGFDPEDRPTETMGLNIMQERANAVGGSLRIESKPGEGTVVTFSWSQP